MTDIIIYIILLLGAALSYVAKKLTLTGAITGAVVGLLIYKGAGLTGIALLALFFIAGTVATGWKRQQKFNPAKSDHGPRTAGQVLANGGMAALLGLLSVFTDKYNIVVPLLIAGSLASAAADTLSSELGMVYGRRFYNIISLKKDTRGLDGVVSIEGTLIGVLGAMLIALIYAVGFGWGITFGWIVLAGFTGNLVDSVLGATLERKGWIGNNMVNFLNTVVGAWVCYWVS